MKVKCLIPWNLKCHNNWFLTILILLASLIIQSVSGQSGIISGSVYDQDSNEPLPGVNIRIDSLIGTVSDNSGYYMIEGTPGAYSINFSYMGYEPVEKVITIISDKIFTLDISLIPKAFELDVTVVSASRYEQRLSDVTVSMEVIKPEFIENQQAGQLDEVLNLVPGVDVLDDQANIRGGSGYSFGTGSRVMMLINGVPALSGDGNEVNWSFLPIENTGQVEIIKGASSSLYGSSALNGVINLRTAWPGINPTTEVEVSGGIYLQPKRSELSWWWDGNPFFGMIRFSHMRKAGNLDIVTGGNVFSDAGYRQDNYKKYGRANLGLRYNIDKLKGISLGMFSSFHYQELSDFLIWQNADSGAFIQNPLAVTPVKGTRIRIDPFVNIFDNGEGKHSLQGRFFAMDNKFDEDADKNNASNLYFAEYQYSKLFGYGMHLTAGVSYDYLQGRAELYGDHFGTSQAVFTQLDWKFFNRLMTSLGFRWEHHSIDNKDPDSRPVMRTGINYQVSQHTFLRASFGQGYRYPSVAEKYTSTSLGSLKIFPNPDLKPETGWSAELGIKQGFKFGTLTGFIDVAGFWTEYNNMMEFIFGIYKPDSVSIPTIDHLGFKSLNIGKARINGVEVSVSGEGKTGKVYYQFFTGYTYMNPLDLSSDTGNNEILKYRYRHSVKGDLSFQLGKFSTGITLVYRSFMERIDKAFEEKILGQEIFPGLKEYRQKNDNGAIIFDLRIGYQVSRSSSISFIIKNLFNNEYMGRPGDIRPPRSISLQYSLAIGK